jgi:hypothetical protein
MPRGVLQHDVLRQHANSAGGKLRRGRPKPQPAEVTKEEVENAIDRASQYLVSRQNKDGSWSADMAAWSKYQVGISSLATLALLNAGKKPTDPAVSRGLDYLRSIKDPELTQVYEISLMIMALAAAKNKDDLHIIRNLAQKLADCQLKDGRFRGGWGYDLNRVGGGDNSNSQFAVLGLREAAASGVNVDREIWERAHRHWVNGQSGDGGWNYKLAGDAQSTGSMTAAGIATMVITESMLREDKDVNPDGTPHCCGDVSPNDALERGIGWMERNFSVGNNPNGAGWAVYYMYGIERAGRLSGRRFFGAKDWYREGARFFVDRQAARNGAWQDGRFQADGDSIVSTSFALLFLSKGLAPVLINKLKYGDSAPLDGARKPAGGLVKAPNWNQHRNDIRNLTDHISNLDKWPKLLTWQQVDLPTILEHGGVQDLLQAPILYLSGADSPDFNEKEIELLKKFVMEGGFIFAVNNCNGRGFDKGIRDLVKAMYPAGDVEPAALAGTRRLQERVLAGCRGNRTAGHRRRLPHGSHLFARRLLVPVGQSRIHRTSRPARGSEHADHQGVEGRRERRRLCHRT